MNGRVLIGLALLSGAAYLAWQRYGAAAPGAAVNPAALPVWGVPAGGAGGGGDLRAQLLAAAAAAGYLDGSLTFDEWNYFLQVLRGVPGPAWEVARVGSDWQRSAPISIDAWLRAVEGLV